jgi:hypothetical protein
MPLGASQHRGSHIPEVSAAVLLSPDEVLLRGLANVRWSDTERAAATGRTRLQVRAVRRLRVLHDPQAN